MADKCKLKTQDGLPTISHSDSTTKLKEKEEQQQKMMNRIQSARNRYKNAFTMHALDHIINGTFVEKIFWTLKLITAISIAGYLSSTLFMSYLNHDTDTVINIETKNRLQLPAVHVCGKDAMTSFSSYADCSSNKSKSYDENVCDLLKDDCPPFVNSTSNFYPDIYDPDVLDQSSKEAEASCVHFGQCIVLNQKGELFQSWPNEQAMRYTMELDSSHFPIYVFVKQPADAENCEEPAETCFFIMKSYFNIDNVHRFGDYHFAFRKIAITRLPYPYSNPSCVVQGSDEARKKNMFCGDYSLGKCLDTCWFRKFLPLCGSIPIAYRYIVRDQDFLASHYRDQNSSSIEHCKEKNKEILDQYYQNCIKECESPCNEVTYELVNKRYEPNMRAGSKVRLFFYFQELKETTIEHVPRLDIATLLANFGGQLGLMAGVSAVSIVELLIWFFLFLTVSFHTFYSRYRPRIVYAWGNIIKRFTKEEAETIGHESHYRSGEPKLSNVNLPGDDPTFLHKCASFTLQRTISPLPKASSSFTNPIQAACKRRLERRDSAIPLKEELENVEYMYFHEGQVNDEKLVNQVDDDLTDMPKRSISNEKIWLTVGVTKDFSKNLKDDNDYPFVKKCTSFSFPKTLAALPRASSSFHMGLTSPYKRHFDNDGFEDGGERPEDEKTRKSQYEQLDENQRKVSEINDNSENISILEGNEIGNEESAIDCEDSDKVDENVPSLPKCASLSVPKEAFVLPRASRSLMSTLRDSCKRSNEPLQEYGEDRENEEYRKECTNVDDRKMIDLTHQNEANQLESSNSNPNMASKIRQASNSIDTSFSFSSGLFEESKIENLDEGAHNGR